MRFQGVISKIPNWQPSGKINHFWILPRMVEEPGTTLYNGEEQTFSYFSILQINLSILEKILREKWISKSREDLQGSTATRKLSLTFKGCGLESTSIAQLLDSLLLSSSHHGRPIQGRHGEEQSYFAAKHNPPYHRGSRHLFASLLSYPLWIHYPRVWVLQQSNSRLSSPILH